MICKIVVPFSLDEPVYKSADVIELCGIKLSWFCKDAEQASSKLTQY